MANSFQERNPFLYWIAPCNVCYHSNVVFLQMRSIITTGRGVLGQLVLEGRVNEELGEYYTLPFSPSLLLIWQVVAGEDAGSQVPLGVSWIVRGMKYVLYYRPITRLIKRVDGLLHIHFSFIEGHEARKTPTFQSLNWYFKTSKSKCFLRARYFLCPGKFKDRSPFKGRSIGLCVYG